MVQVNSLYEVALARQEDLLREAEHARMVFAARAAVAPSHGRTSAFFTLIGRLLSSGSVWRTARAGAQ